MPSLILHLDMAMVIINLSWSVDLYWTPWKSLDFYSMIKYIFYLLHWTIRGDIKQYSVIHATVYYVK